MTLFGESAGGWSVSHQLVGSSFLIQLSSVLFVQFSVLGCFSRIPTVFQMQVNPAAEGLFRGKQAFLGLNVLKMIDS